MPQFVNPFTGLASVRPLRHEDLVRALRVDLAAEEEAAFLYTAHADATDNRLVRQVLMDIAAEEIVHAGEFHRLIELLSPEEAGRLMKGRDEVNNLARQLSQIMES